MRTRRSDLDAPGLRRRRRGAGFSYTDTDGAPLTDGAALERIRALAVPPAWRDVWISPDPAGHIQAVGVDAADRRQYLYHADWRARRDVRKFDRVAGVAARLPALRRTVAGHLGQRGLGRDRVLAACVRLLDTACVRIGSESYAAADEPSFGLATLTCGHVRVRGSHVWLEFPAKSGVTFSQEVVDAELAAVVRPLVRRGPDAELFGYRVGRSWSDVRSTDVNDYLREHAGVEITAKDFRTWHATVLAAVLLARSPVPGSATARRRTVAGVMREVAELLGNTPAVARASYVDPRVLDAFAAGRVVPVRLRAGEDPADLAVRIRAEGAVAELLDGGA